MKRFTYTTKRRICRTCEGDGMGRIFPSAPCWSCGGVGHTSEPVPDGERHVVITHDQSGAEIAVDIADGTAPPSSGRIASVLFTLLVLAAIAGAIALGLP